MVVLCCNIQNSIEFIRIDHHSDLENSQKTRNQLEDLFKVDRVIAALFPIMIDLHDCHCSWDGCKLVD